MNTEIHEDENIPSNGDIKLVRRVKALEKAIEKLATKEDVAEIVRNTMLEVLFKTGKGTKAILVTMATLVGALAVIAGGIYWFLKFIGFIYIGK